MPLPLPLDCGLLSHPGVGGSWEGFCIETLIAAAPLGTEPFFYRTSVGAELNLELRPFGGETWAIEINPTTRPKVSRGFYLAIKDIGAASSILVYARHREAPLGDNLRTLPMAVATALLRSQM